MTERPGVREVEEGVGAWGMIHGRFQPFHTGHLEYLVAAAARCERLVVGITNPEGFPIRPSRRTRPGTCPSPTPSPTPSGA